MASSPPEAVLGEIAGRYEEAAEAVIAGQTEDAARLVGEAGDLLARVPAETEASGPVLERLQRAHRALCDAVAADRRHTLELLDHQRRGQRTLSAYAGRLPVAGTRVERDA